MSTWHPTRWLTGYSWDALTAGCLLGRERPRSMLLLGLGAGTVVRQLWRLVPDLEVTAVDLDPKAIRTARRYLRERSGQATLIEANAYTWLARCRKRFDAVVDDVYASGPADVYRPAPLDRALVEQLAGHTTPDGVVVANLVTSTGHRTTYSAARRAFAAVFPSWRSVRPPKGYNTVLVGGADLASASCLAPWSEEWPSPDRRLWRGLRVGR